MKKLQSLGKNLSKNEQKSILGGIALDSVPGNYCCSGPGFGTECYNNVTKSQAEANAIFSIYVNGCTDVNSFECYRLGA